MAMPWTSPNSQYIGPSEPCRDGKEGLRKRGEEVKQLHDGLHHEQVTACTVTLASVRLLLEELYLLQVREPFVHLHRAKATKCLLKLL